MKAEKVEKLVANFNNKFEYVINLYVYLRNLEQALDHGLVLKMYWYEYWSNKRSKNWFWKRFLKLIDNPVFGKTMENVRNDGDIKLVTTEKQSHIFWSNKYYFNFCFLVS